MDQKFWNVFLEVYENLPRQGPGNKESAARALEHCPELPQNPRILDLGCGVGGQTLYLSKLTNGTILAVDTHSPSIQRLEDTIKRKNLTHQIQTLVGDMSKLDLSRGTYDLVWSEGALYQITIPKALKISFDLLKPGGYLVFTDAVWLKANPPEAVKEGFEGDYPSMGNVEQVKSLITKSRFILKHHFPLPYEAWWTDFYTPMEVQIRNLQNKYQRDPEVLEILSVLAREPQLHRDYSDYFGYEFFVLQKPRNE